MCPGRAHAPGLLLARAAESGRAPGGAPRRGGGGSVRQAAAESARGAACVRIWSLAGGRRRGAGGGAWGWWGASHPFLQTPTRSYRPPPVLVRCVHGAVPTDQNDLQGCLLNKAAALAKIRRRPSKGVCSTDALGLAWTLQVNLSSATRARRARIWSVELRGGAHDRQQPTVRDVINAGGRLGLGGAACASFWFVHSLRCSSEAER